MGWHGHLALKYHAEGDRTLAHDRHTGPLRVLQRLYPESERVCHHVLVHPPGGVAGGDQLHVDLSLDTHAHALITTPGATRFYRSAAEPAVQSVAARLAPGARLEWLPLEALAYRGCRAVNRMRFELAPGAAMIGWDVLALGLPAAGEAFDDPAHPEGHYTQEIHLPGIWLEKGTVRASDAALLDSPLGWAGRRTLGCLWLATGQAMDASLRSSLQALARASIDTLGATTSAGCTSPDDRLVLMRVLADRVEPMMGLLTAVWGQWRHAAWALPPCPPRVWRT